MFLLVKLTGTKWWRMNYRHLGSQRTVSFGRYPQVSLAEARQRLIKARRLIAMEPDLPFRNRDRLGWGDRPAGARGAR